VRSITYAFVVTRSLVALFYLCGWVAHVVIPFVRYVACSLFAFTFVSFIVPFTVAVVVVVVVGTFVYPPVVHFVRFVAVVDVGFRLRSLLRYRLLPLCGCRGCVFVWFRLFTFIPLLVGLISTHSSFAVVVAVTFFSSFVVRCRLTFVRCFAI